MVCRGSLQAFGGALAGATLRRTRLWYIIIGKHTAIMVLYRRKWSGSFCKFPGYAIVTANSHVSYRPVSSCGRKRSKYLEFRLSLKSRVSPATRSCFRILFLAFFIPRLCFASCVINALRSEEGRDARSSLVTKAFKLSGRDIGFVFQAKFPDVGAACRCNGILLRP